MEERTLIIHGYSDCSDSFVQIKNFLAKAGVGTVDSIYYADYQSREDSLTFDDVIRGLNDKLVDAGFIEANGKKRCDLNVVVHSTGGLVIRHWLWRYYMRDGLRVDDCPVKRLVMLAPANFGSPLAHRGKSFLGELVKGRWKVGDLFEVGRLILDGLELGSPFQWDLAHHDLLGEEVLFRADRIHVTILVGADDYTGIAAWVNKPGTDGTVVIAGTSLDSAKMILSPGDSRTPVDWHSTKTVDQFAFGVLPGLNHGTIVDTFKEDADGGLVGPLLLRGLRTGSPDDFARLIKDLDDTTESTYKTKGADGREKYKMYQQFIVRCVDDQGNRADDFTLEFVLSNADPGSEDNKGSNCAADGVNYSDEASRLLTAEFHQHSVDPSYRRFLFVPSEMIDLMTRAKTAYGSDVRLMMRVYVPGVEKGIQYDCGCFQHVVLADTAPPPPPGSNGLSFLYPNTTTLLEIRTNRVNEYVFVGTTPRDKEERPVI